MSDPLETVDLNGVEILSVGGPIHGRGSPPEGDFWTTDQLRAMVDADAELHGELNPTVSVNPPANKVGHVEQPAVGYLEQLRLNEDGTRLLADVKKVPKKLADLIEAGAYRARSVDLSSVTSQTTGKKYDWVVTGLAWLGAKLPAVRTLDDVYALYEGDGVDLRLVVEYATAGDIVWDPGSSFEAIRAAISLVLNPGPGIESRYWVRDVSDGKALVCEGYGDEGTAWVVTYTVDADGNVTLPPSTDWTQAEQTWVATSKAYAEETGPGDSGPPSDTRGRVPELNLNEEQRRAFADALGVKPDDLTDEQLLAAVKPKPDEDQDTELRELEQKEVLRRLEAQETRAEKLERELHDERRAAFVDKILSEGRAKPAQRESIERMYDDSAENALKFFAEQPVDEDLVREFGSGDDGNELNEEQRAEEEDREYAAAHGSRFGFTSEDLI